MKKLIVLLLVILLCIPVFAACGDKDDDDDVDDIAEIDDDDDDDYEEVFVDDDKDSFENEVAYVMIYNPYIYNENDDPDRTGLSTGDLENQINIDLNKADPIEQEREFYPVSVKDILNGKEMPEIDFSMERADVIQPVYEEGDTHEFYCGIESRELEEFTCIYEGEYCYVWALDDSIDEDEAEEYGEEFDENIFERETEEFGEARFTDDGGKVHILYYDFHANGVLGFFYRLDLFSSNELSPAEIDYYELNTDHAIINVNSAYTSDEKLMYATMAHEFQHLLSFTDYFFSKHETVHGTWIDEAMSGYIEEDIYHGIKEEEGDFDAYQYSVRIRSGQSLYNFATTMGGFGNYDIGVYGSVYFFTGYLKNLLGDDVFGDIHSYWRTTKDRNPTDASSIYNAASDSVKEKIDDFLDYPDSIDLDDEDEWLSKMTLHFYISMLGNNKYTPDDANELDKDYMVYDEYNPADIEGGGRIIVATNDGSFTIPDDADDGLIYIGLDEHFEPVNEYLYR